MSFAIVAVNDRFKIISLEKYLKKYYIPIHSRYIMDNIHIRNAKERKERKITMKDMNFGKQ